MTFLRQWFIDEEGWEGPLGFVTLQEYRRAPLPAAGLETLEESRWQLGRGAEGPEGGGKGERRREGQRTGTVCWPVWSRDQIQLSSGEWIRLLGTRKAASFGQQRGIKPSRAGSGAGGRTRSQEGRWKKRWKHPSFSCFICICFVFSTHCKKKTQTTRSGQHPLFNENRRAFSPLPPTSLN